MNNLLTANGLVYCKDEVEELDSRLNWLLRIRHRAVLLSGNNPRQVVHMQCASVTKQYSLVPVKGQ